MSSPTFVDWIRTNAAKASHRWLPVQDIDILLSRAAVITCKYSQLYRRSYYGGIAGAGDNKSMLQLLRKGLSSDRAEFEKDTEQLRPSNGTK